MGKGESSRGSREGNSNSFDSHFLLLSSFGRDYGL